MLVMAAMIAASALFAPPAPGATYPLFGAGVDDLRPGRLAAEVQIRSQPISLAARGDGVVAFSTGGEVYWVQNGRLSLVHSLTGEFPRVGLAFAPDGTLIVSACAPLRPISGPPETPSMVWRVAPGRASQWVAGQLLEVGFSGDGGPATRARLDCPTGVAVDAAGGILIADSGAGRVRRVGPDGVISTVAGTGRADVAGDGGPATQAALGAPVDVAALPNGGFAVADRGVDTSPTGRAKRGGIRIIDATGVITTRSREDATQLDAVADGSLLFVDRGDDVPRVRRLFPDGRIVTAVNLARDRVGIPAGIPVAGDPFSSDRIDVDAAIATPDQGMLVAADFAILYVTPAVPSRLAVALRSPTRQPRPRLEAHLTLTMPAQVRLEAWRRGRRAATSTADLPAGNVVLALGTKIPPGEYLIRVRATTGDGQVAAAHAWALVGGLLPVEYARSFVQSRFDLLTTYLDEPVTHARCQRVARRRVDCALLARRRCAGVATVRVRPDGTLSLARYKGNRRCRRIS